MQNAGARLSTEKIDYAIFYNIRRRP